MKRNNSDISKWETSLQIVSEEMLFLEKLLRTEIFEPNIPNLYERLQQFTKNLEELKKEKTALEDQVEKHAAGISEGLEVPKEQKASQFNESHLNLKKIMKAFLNKFSGLKLEIFNFTGNILKKSR